MANPKRRHSRSRGGKRMAAQRPVAAQVRPCPRCGAQGRPHTVCDNCGHYKGREVIVKDEF
jgi:large subunit ribosomal protein L32